MQKKIGAKLLGGSDMARIDKEPKEDFTIATFC